MMHNLESIQTTLELLKNGTRGKSELCKRTQGKYSIKRMWLFKAVRLLCILLPFALVAYLILK